MASPTMDESNLIFVHNPQTALTRQKKHRSSIHIKMTINNSSFNNTDSQHVTRFASRRCMIHLLVWSKTTQRWGSIFP